MPLFHPPLPSPGRIMNFETLAIIFVAIAVGAFAKGLTGIGLPIITIPILSGILGAEHAIVTMAIPVFVSNISIVWTYRKLATTIPRLRTALAFAVAGTLIGVYILASLDDRALIDLIIVWIGVYLLNLMVNPNFQLTGRAATIGSPILAALAGIAQGSTGMSGPVVATWIHSYRFQKEAYVFAVSVMFLFISGTQVAAVAAGGLMDRQKTIEGLLAAIPTLLFVPLGMRTIKYVSPRMFNWIILTCIVVMEARLVWKQFLSA